MRSALAMVAATALLASAGVAHALKCASGTEVLHLELAVVSVDGTEERTDPVEVELVGGFTVGFDGASYTPLTECGSSIATESIQPDPPADGDPCSHPGLHCHWPEVGELCAARCNDGAWHPTGCPPP